MTEPADPAESADETRPASLAYLDRVRTGWRRLTPREAYDAQQAGAVLIDTRTSEQRALTAEIPGAMVIDRTVLEWRLDPTFDWRIPEATRFRRPVRRRVPPRVQFERGGQGAARRRLHRATDVIGGFAAWEADGLPVTHEPPDVRP